LIIIHHSASADVPAAEINAWHLARGWAGIVYHFVIRKDGSIERGRPQQAIGAHAGPGANGHSIGICLCGNFMKELPSDAQMVSLLVLIAWLKNYYKALKNKDEIYKPEIFEDWVVHQYLTDRNATVEKIKF
jgi:N-acetylmuramoyl-L-alanine amidase